MTVDFVMSLQCLGFLAWGIGFRAEKGVVVQASRVGETVYVNWAEVKEFSVSCHNKDRKK